MTTRESLIEKYRLVQMLMNQARGARCPTGAFSDRSRGQGRVLALLKLKDGLSTKELANILGVRVASLNETLSKMEAAGVVERKPSEQDRRVMLVYLTEQGRTQEQGNPAEDIDLLAGFSVDELDILEDFLDRMIANLEKALGPETVQTTRDGLRSRRELFDHVMASPGGEHPAPSAPPAPPLPPQANGFDVFGYGGPGGAPMGFAGFGEFPGFGMKSEEE